MKKGLYFAVTMFALFSLVPASAGENIVLEDADVSMSYQELSHFIESWSLDMKQAAANDEGDLIELLSMTLANKRVASEFEQLEPRPESADYWETQFKLRNIKRDYVVKRHMQSLDVPEMAALAKERFQAQKEKYARVPERRLSSHILLACPPGECKRGPRLEEARQLIAELREGRSFEELATEHSEDPGSRKRGGQFARWLTKGEPRVDANYVGAVFELENEGDVSKPVSTKFGIHIIRLDGIQETRLREFADVRDQVIADLEAEYRGLARKEFFAQYRLSESATIDAKAISKILTPYRDD